MLSRNKGARVEREVVHAHQERGIAATKESRAYKPGHDISVPYEDTELRLEVKARANGFRELYAWLKKDNADGLILKADRRRPLVTTYLDLWLEILTKADGIG